MKPAPFQYVRASSIDDALAGLAGHGDDAKVLAGGQSLIALMNLRLVRPAVLVDINRLSDLAYIRQENGTLAIGALTRQSAVESSDVIARLCPLMAEAIRFVGHRPIRNRGTVGGNLAHADPASELPAVALALDAEFEVASASGSRRVPASEFFIGTWTTAVESGELLTAIHFPALGGAAWGDRLGFAVEEIARRSGDFALAGAV